MAGNAEVYGDPQFQGLLSDYDRASRVYWRCIVDLRAYHLNTPPEKIDEWRSALLQERTDTALRQLEDALAALTEYGWRLVPYSSTSEHQRLAIDAEKWFHKKRLEGAGWRPGAFEPSGQEERLDVDGLPITIVLHDPPKADQRSEDR